MTWEHKENQGAFLSDCGLSAGGEGAPATKGSKSWLQSPDSAPEPVVSVAPMEH